MGPAPSDFVYRARSEWREFFAHRIRATQLLDAAADLQPRYVLDVGCGGGQEMIPFAERGARAIGVDISMEVGRTGRDLLSTLDRRVEIAYICGAAEALPFPDRSFDVVICRVALPYMDNAKALSEMLRVLRPGGVVLIQIHEIRYYLEKLMGGLRSRNPATIRDGLKAIAAGAVYHLIGRQVRRWPIGKETFQSEWLLRRELAKAGAALQRRLPLKNKRAPAYRIVRL
jgi:ubiquinone/menaquinone biosynthesis C-methylase UbiE